MTFFNQRFHIAVEECQQQGSDVGSVHVRVGHDYDLVVTELFNIKILLSIQGVIDALTVAENAERLKEAEL